jgi:hypothetical protein
MKYAYYISVALLTSLILLFYVMTRKKEDIQPPLTIPHIGSVQILNGCGTAGAAQVISDLLRNKGFDVKEIANAPDWNYKATLVASRTKDGGTAALLGKALGTSNVILLRNNAGLFDATVFVGEDYLKLAGADKN